jgi:hypothetical protein
MSQQTNTASFILDAPAFPLEFPNAVYQSTGNLTVSYTVNGAPATLTIVIEGISSPASANTDFGAQPGSPTLLDTYSSTSSTSNRSVALNGVFYNAFRVTGTWTGGTNVTIAGSITLSGPGTSFSAQLHLTNLKAD